jgi:TonB-like protein
MTVVFINEVSPTVERLAPLEPRDLASRGVELPDLPVVVLSPDPTPAAQDDPQSEDGSPVASDHQAQHALLYGRYLGQVQARIERAWTRPRSEIGAPQFSCRARIAQDRKGSVVDIRLDHCNGAPRWQQSLESAIRTASPLPAPPDPSVYADRLWLTFHSEGFRQDGSPDGFEPEDRRTLVAAVQAPQRDSLEHLAERFGGRLQSPDNKHAEVIHLTIIGTPNAAAPAAQPSPAEPPPNTAEDLQTQ